MVLNYIIWHYMIWYDIILRLCDTKLNYMTLYYMKINYDKNYKLFHVRLYDIKYYYEYKLWLWLTLSLLLLVLWLLNIITKKYILFHIPHSGPKINMNIYEHIWTYIYILWYIYIHTYSTININKPRFWLVLFNILGNRVIA